MDLLHQLDISDLGELVLDGCLNSHANGRWSLKSDFAHSLLHFKHLRTVCAFSTAQQVLLQQAVRTVYI